MKKHPFCSAAWVGAARDYITAQCADRDISGIEIAFCEKFTDAPQSVATEAGGITGWHCRIGGGKVEVGLGVLENADLTITADYETVVPLARIVFAGNPEGAAAARKVVAEATAQGRMKREGNDQAMATAPFLAGLHDALARQTA